MALPINIEDLLNKRKIEGNRIEFKKGWNPADIYHSICAFANDFDNLGGGYILVGVEQHDNGLAKRPVAGINIEAVDGILKQMVGFNNMFDPYYLPRTSVEEVDGQQVLVIWAPSGVNRPYAIPMDVQAKVKQMRYYVRSGSSSIIAKGEVLDELRDMANRVPFDERPNPNIAMSDISLYPIADAAMKGSYAENFVMNGAYWKIIAYCTAVGGCLLSVGSVSGLMLMKMEHIRLGWYIKNLTPKVLAGALIGLAVLWVELNIL